MDDATRNLADCGWRFSLEEVVIPVVELTIRLLLVTVNLTKVTLL
jgi:hypothetical protein